MASGKRAFESESPVETMNAILSEDPPGLPHSVPPGLDRIVRRCLEKQPAQRFQSAADLGFALQSLLVAPASAERPKPQAWQKRVALGAAGLTLLSLAFIAFQHFSERPPAPAALLRFQIPVPEGVMSTAFPSLSPDGRKLAFLAAKSDGENHLWVHFLDSGESRELTPAWGSPFWSPDSRFIGYGHQGKLKKIQATGGTPQVLTDLDGGWAGGSWSKDDLIVFGMSGSGCIFRVPASGGIPTQLTALDPARQELRHFLPSVLPDGRHFVYIRRSASREKSGIYVGSVDARPEQQSTKPLVASHWGPVYARSEDPRTGYLLFMREDSAMAQPFDQRRLELTGDAVVVAEQVGDNNQNHGFGNFSASANDVLVFCKKVNEEERLTWYGRDGKVLGTISEPAEYTDLALSPDEKRLVVAKRNGLATNFWLLDLAGGGSTQFTFGPTATDQNPVWSPDGSRIIFSSTRQGRHDLYQKLVSGVKDEEILLKSAVDDTKNPTSWSSDGRFLLYDSQSPKTKADIWVLPLEGNRKPVPFLVTNANEDAALFSPDGRWVTYESDESGQSEVYIRSFSMNSDLTAVEPGRKWLVSTGGGSNPRWRGSGKELLYISQDGKVMSVNISADPAFLAGTPRPVVSVAGPFDIWDSTADGRRFLSPVEISQPPGPFTILLNWQAALKK